jgi:hypothetical protein
MKDLNHYLNEQQESNLELNESVMETIVNVGFLSAVSIIPIGITFWTLLKDENKNKIKKFINNDVIARINVALGKNKKANEIIKRLKENPEIENEIKNSKSGDFRKTIKKFVTEKEFELIADIVRNNIETGELDRKQSLKRDFNGNIKNSN